MGGNFAPKYAQQQVGADEGVGDHMQALSLACHTGAVDGVVQGDEVGAMPLLDSGQAQADRQMAFADAGWSQEEDVFTLVQEAQRGQLFNECLTSTIPPLGDNYFSRSASQFSGLQY